MRRRSIWLALLYALATLAAPDVHDHGGDRHQAPRPDASCEAQGVHLAAHTDVPDLTRHPETCPACQVQTEHQASRPTLLADNLPVLQAGSLPLPLVLERFPFRLLPSRAPPIA